MGIFTNPWMLVGVTALLSIGAMLLSRSRVTVEGFFVGQTDGRAPRLWVLVLSQVTTWIFARSLMNAAILGYFYGFAGTLAYTFYYLSFVTGGFIISRLRAGGATSLQGWLVQHFGRVGGWSYNAIIALRLLSEVFANLIVIGLIFAAIFPEQAERAEITAIVVLAIVGLVYSAKGGLSASLKTDVLQMIVFLTVFSIALLILISSSGFSFSALVFAEGVHAQASRPGWVLVVVALLQVFSYPAHDPVMMDRGFIADEATTKRSFILAFILSAFCIMGFGFFGIQAGLVGAEYTNQLLGTWAEMFGPFVFFLLMVSLIASAVSTLDSALSSASRLVIEELKIGARTIWNGRIAMGVFMLLGTLLTLFPNKTLFDAVAVTGTASMFLTPVLISTFLRLSIPIGAYLVAWCAAVLGAAAYMFRGTELVQLVAPGLHKYDQLLLICLLVLAVGFGAIAIGALWRSSNWRDETGGLLRS